MKSLNSPFFKIFSYVAASRECGEGIQLALLPLFSLIFCVFGTVPVDEDDSALPITPFYWSSLLNVPCSFFLLLFSGRKSAGTLMNKDEYKRELARGSEKEARRKMHFKSQYQACR